MARLMLHLLGAPYAENDDAPITFETRKALALLAFLALSGGVHTRDALAALLWPELDQPHAYGALRYTLSILKKQAGAELLATTRDHTSLATNSNLVVDVAEFERAVKATHRHEHHNHDLCSTCVAALTSAINHYRGDFMSGFTLRDSAAFDEWQLVERERLQHEFAHALDRLAHAHAAAGGWETAIDYARRWLALDPLHEPAHALLMQCYTAVGRRSTALRQYARYVALVQRELNASPSEGFTQLYHDIKQRRFVAHSPKPPATHTLPQPETIVAAPPVFVARETELARLNKALDQARQGHGQICFVVGEAGSGKTALLQAFAHHAQQHDSGLVVVAGACSGQTGPGDPFLPFRAILNHLVGTTELMSATVTLSPQASVRNQVTAAATRALRSSGAVLIDTFVSEQLLVDHGAPRSNTLDQPEQTRVRHSSPVSLLPRTPQASLVDQYAAVLQALAVEQPMLLLLDDLQWADAASIELLFHLGRRINTERVLIIGAYRPDDVARRRSGERHPLVPVVHELTRFYGDIRIDLDQAVEARGKHLIDALIDSAPNELDATFRAALYEQTGGQPLFTIETLRGLVERGDLVYDQQRHLVPGPAINWNIVPARVEAVIAERIERLSEDLREMLTIASVEGEVFTAEVIAWVQGSETRGIQRSLSDEFEKRQHFVRALGCERVEQQVLCRYRFRHMLYQKYLYSKLDLVERALLHGEVGAVLEQIYGAESALIAVELARHFQESGDTAKAAGYLLLAAQQALRLSAGVEAAEHCNRGIALLQTLPNTPARARQELALQTTLGVCLNIVKGYASTEVGLVFNRALHLGAGLNEHRELFMALWGTKAFHDQRVEHDISLALAYQLLEVAQRSNDPMLLPIGSMVLGYTLLMRGELMSARSHLEHAAALYESERHSTLFLRLGPDPGVTMLTFLSWALWLLGYPDQARHRSRQALELAHTLDHAFSRVYATILNGVLYELCRDATTCRKLTEDRLEGLEQFTMFYALARERRGWVTAMQGELAAGLQELQAGHAALHATGATVSDTHYHVLVAEIYHRLGQVDLGLAHVDQGLAVVERSGERHFEAELHRVRGELLATRLPLDAQASFRRALAVAAGQHAKSLELRAAMGLARLLQRQNRGDEALALLHPIYIWFTEGFDTLDLQEAQHLLELLAPERHQSLSE